MSNNIICSATRSNGNQCKATAVAGQLQCIGHLPNAEANRSLGRVAASPLARLQKFIPQDLRELKTDLYKALDDVHKQRISPQQGAAMATIANAIIKVYETAELNAELQEAKEMIAEKIGVKNG